MVKLKNFQKLSYQKPVFVPQPILDGNHLSSGCTSQRSQTRQKPRTSSQKKLLKSKVVDNVGCLKMVPSAPILPTHPMAALLKTNSKTSEPKRQKSVKKLRTKTESVRSIVVKPKPTVMQLSQLFKEAASNKKLLKPGGLIIAMTPKQVVKIKTA